MTNLLKVHNKAPSQGLLMFMGFFFVCVVFFFTILPIITVKVLIL